MKRFTSKNQKIGELGEDIAVKFLVKHSFDVLERNYTLKTGEIDIITSKNGKLHFWEVKTTQSDLLSGNRTYNPFENIHAKKLKRFIQSVEQYLVSHNVPHETICEINGLAVYLDVLQKKARVEIMENLV